MAIGVNDILRITANMQMLAADQMVNVYNLKVTAIVAPTDLSYMQSISAFLDEVYTAINADIVNNVLYVDIGGINITQDELLPTVTWDTLVSGANAGKILPVQSAACVFFPTTTPRVRASKFFGGYSDNALEVDGQITAAAQARLKTAGDVLVAGMAELGDNAQYGAYNALLNRFTLVDRAVVPTRWRTQRRRRLGVGS